MSLSSVSGLHTALTYIISELPLFYMYHWVKQNLLLLFYLFFYYYY